MVNKSAKACIEILRGQLVTKILLPNAAQPHLLLLKNLIVTWSFQTLRLCLYFA